MHTRPEFTAVSILFFVFWTLSGCLSDVEYTSDDASSSPDVSATDAHPDTVPVDSTNPDSDENPDSRPDTSERDRDDDGVLDASDNCLDTPNEEQADRDEDGKGDACDIILEVSPATAIELRDIPFDPNWKAEISAIGDYNDDGRADFAIGTPAAADGAGEVHIFSGTRISPTTESLKLNDRSATWFASNKALGFDITGVGDVNGDGQSDLTVGAEYRGQQELAHLISGDPTFSGTKMITNVADLALYSESQLCCAPEITTLPVGRIDQDGSDDFVFAELTSKREFRVVFSGKVSDKDIGNDTPWETVAATVSLPGQGDGNTPITVRNLDDVDGDDASEIAVHDPNSPASSGGKGYILPSTSLPTSPGSEVSTPNVAQSTIELTASDSTSRIEPAGDVNGDGLADFLLTGDDSQKSHLFFGKAKFSTSIDVSSADISINHSAAARFATASDLDNDGFSDLLFAEGSKVVLYHGSGTPTSSADLTRPDTPRFDIMAGNITDQIDLKIVSIGDINNDEVDDIGILVMPDSDIQTAGVLYILRGPIP